MERFAFVIHPLSAADIARKYQIAALLPESWVEFAMRFKSPMLVSHITGIQSPTGAEAEGWFVGCPYTPKLLLERPLEEVYAKLVKTVKIAEEQGAKIVGLGAFTSVVGDGGITIAKHSKIAVTTGNSYTVATAVEGALKGAELMKTNPAEATVAVVGATGSIGATCAEIFAETAARVVLVGRSDEKLAALAERLRTTARSEISVTKDVAKGIADADIVIAVSSSVDAVILPPDIKPGAVVCDVARPRDVSVRVAKERKDVLVIEGGVVRVPGAVDFNFNFGFPPRTAYACMSETMILALEKRYENFTLGKDVSVAQVKEISALAKKHGFKIEGFRSFEKALTEEQINNIRLFAGRS